LWLPLAAEGVRDSRQRSEASANRRYGLTLIESIRRDPKKYQHEQERKPLSTRCRSDLRIQKTSIRGRFRVLKFDRVIQLFLCHPEDSLSSTWQYLIVLTE